RRQPVRAAVPPAGLAQSDFEILAQIAEAAGVAFPQTIEAVRKEMKALAVPPGAARAVTVGPLAPVPATGLLLATSHPLLDDGTMLQNAASLAQTAGAVTTDINPAAAARPVPGATAGVRA